LYCSGDGLPLANVTFIALVFLWAFIRVGLFKYYENEIKFPAGAGWQVDELVTLPFTLLRNGVYRDRERKVRITCMVFDEDNVLAAMTYRWYVGDELDHEYTYMCRGSMAYTY
jgi:hypothetical protein